MLVPVVAIAGLVFLPARAASGASSASNPTLEPATEIYPPSDSSGDSLYGVSCPTLGDCTAVGDYDNGTGYGWPMVATEVSGNWTSSKVGPPADASTSNAIFDGVSCPSVDDCEAAGYYFDTSNDGQAMVATEASGSWAQATAVTPPSNAGANPNAIFESVSCPTFGDCVAAGYYFDSSGVEVPMIATETSGIWGQASEVAAPEGYSYEGFYGISCPSSGNCTVAGSYSNGESSPRFAGAMVATESSGTWAQATAVSPPSDAGSNPGASFSGISCATVDNCTAAGRYFSSTESSPCPPMVASETSGTWAQATAGASPADTFDGGCLSGFDGISCPSADNCMVVGGYENTSGEQLPMVSTENAGSWAQATAVALPANAGSSPQNVSFTGVSCSVIGGCTAIGNYNNLAMVSSSIATESSSGVLVAFGDSVAAGEGDTASFPSGSSCLSSQAVAYCGYDQDEWTDSPDAYPTVLAQSLGWSANNFAISGACAEQSEGPLLPNCEGSRHPTVSQEIATASTMQLHPSLVTLTVGADDIDFKDCFFALVDPLRVARTPLRIYRLYKATLKPT